MIRLRAETPSTSHPLPLPPPNVLPHTRASVAISGVFEATLPPQKRLCIALGLRYEVGESLSALTARPTRGCRADYGFISTLDDKIRRDPKSLFSTILLIELSQRMTAIAMTVRQDTYEIYRRLDDAQDDRLSMSGWLNMLFRDRRAHAHTTLLIEREARLSCKAWRWSMDSSVTARSEVTVLQGQQGPASGLAQLEIPEEAAPKRTTRANPANTIATTFVTNAQLKEMINQGVTVALAARDADRSMNGDDSLNLGTGVRRNDISNCPMENQIKFSTCTLFGSALTWWNSHVKTVGHDVAYAMTWADLKKKMTDKYCPRTKIKKLKAELWNLKVKGTNVIGYNQHFQELALLCVRMFPEELNKIERYVCGLPDMIHGSVVASKPKTMKEAIEIV
ncbi:reverse transcriptase domain-containing protein [Tanacetum coccineum]